jgi:hypothetical protein
LSYWGKSFISNEILPAGLLLLAASRPRTPIDLGVPYIRSTKTGPWNAKTSKIAYPAEEKVTEPGNSLLITHSTTRNEVLSLKLVCR